MAAGGFQHPARADRDCSFRVDLPPGRSAGANVVGEAVRAVGEIRVLIGVASRVVTDMGRNSPGRSRPEIPQNAQVGQVADCRGLEHL